jgi:hypothetical protein
LVRELIPAQLWSFEQLQGIFYVAVPIRMTVARVRGGLMLYAPVAPTAEVCRHLRDLEERFGPVLSIVLPTASGLEHKLPVPAMARAFPEAEVWVFRGAGCGCWGTRAIPTARIWSGNPSVPSISGSAASMSSPACIAPPVPC